VVWIQHTIKQDAVQCFRSPIVHYMLSYWVLLHPNTYELVNEYLYVLFHCWVDLYIWPSGCGRKILNNFHSISRWIHIRVQKVALRCRPIPKIISPGSSCGPKTPFKNRSGSPGGLCDGRM
jgi:hypothetical protein